MQIFPPSVRSLWEKWELRFMVLSSLIFQSILILLGNKRKHCTSTWLRITLWFAYLLADWLATISLGVLSNQVGYNEGDFVEPKYVIISLWAPLLLLHLGGLDTITAYSMEDNELWSRRFLSFIVQVVVTLYVFLRTWTDTDLDILAIPIFIAGIIKMGERIWVLWSASSQQFKESLFPDPDPDPGPNYARYMESYIAASDEGYMVDVQGLETPSVGDDLIHAAAEANIVPLPKTDTYGPEIVKIAHKFLKTFKPLFADLILSFHDVLESRLSLQNGSGKEVFQVMEVELGFMYDLFYTKATVTYSFMGSFLRLVTLSCNVSVLCAFFVTQKNQYPNVDVFVTYLLLLGAITLEIYSGDRVLERFKDCKELEWSVKGEFDQSILLWHIATDICYNCVSGEDADNSTGPSFREASKLLSEYMLYLLVMRPSMLPNGIGEIRFQDTCAEATEFVKDRKSIKCKKEACQMLLKVSSESKNVLPSE
ncbi:DUF594 family protein [Spatholobus suberectus]|nr:DUF594 family protein [Spatholobus suberectus]